tara:strand:+ start:116 stop:388 length:273 start_codon:yes stop_codon:yes gene_type:complete
MFLENITKSIEYNAIKANYVYSKNVSCSLGGVMSIQENQAIKSIEVALDHAINRLGQLKGSDKIAFEKEYKEWLADEKVNEKVWFSIAPY